MPDMTPQEEAISPQLTEQHRALIAGLGRFERDSLAKYVNPGTSRLSRNGLATMRPSSARCSGTGGQVRRSRLAGA